MKDNGPGISKEDQLKLFQPFFQVERSIYRNHGGSGLGLAISKGLVEAHGGKMWVESVLNKGTTFCFTLPVKPSKNIKPIKLMFSSK